MIDLHFHLLPGIDDGPETVSEALGLARTAVAAGTSKVVATPHVSSAYPETTALKVADAVQLLDRALREEDVPLHVLPGAEVALGRAVELADDELWRLRLGGGPWLLIECPFEGPSSAWSSMLDELNSRGHRVLLAHPERVQGLRDNRPLLERLVAQGMLCQLTASAFGGAFGGDVQRTALRMAREGLAHVVASDAHSPQRPPSIRPELEAAGLTTDGIEYLTVRAPLAVLNGTAIPMPPALSGPGVGSRLRRRLRAS